MSTHPKLFSPLILLAALGVLSVTQAGAAEVDTSQWTCAKCPLPQGTTGAVDVGAGYNSDASAAYGNYTGLRKKGAQLVLGGQLAYRGEGGYFADLAASDLGIDTRSLSAQTGREGLYTLRLGYAEVPRSFADGAQTPFSGSGGATLALPGGFPAADTPSMPLGTTLQPVELGYKAKRFDLSGTWVGQEHWAYRVSLRRDVRDGSKPGAGSFFSTASQLALPVDQTTDQLEVAASYATSTVQATLAYQLSQFKTGAESLTWSNPFVPVVPGANRGQLALAPQNQFQQIVASVGYQISSTLRASADLAYGKGEQNATYLDPTLNTDPLAGLPGRLALPAQSLDGQVTTFNLNAKLTATPMEGLRLNAIYARDIRDNETAMLAYPQVATDMFLNTARTNVPFGLTQDRLKLNASYRGLESWKLSGGLDWDNRQRTYQESVRTRETTIWGRATVQARDDLALTLNLAYGDRNNSSYGVAPWFGATQNPLMRKFNLAARERATAGTRADWTLSESVSLGLGVDWTHDDYNETEIGLNESETVNLVADIAVAVSENTRLHAFGQAQKLSSHQTSSQAFAGPDWTGKVVDRFDVLGFGIKHAAIPDKLDLGADVSFARARSDTAVTTAIGEPPYPRDRNSRDTLKVYATYKLQDRLSLTGSWWYELQDATDWRLDNVQPAAVANLLALGTTAPQYRVNVVRMTLRYSF